MGCFLVVDLMGFVPLCRPSAVGAGSAAELPWMGVFPERQELLPTDGTYRRPGGFPVFRFGMSVLPLEPAPFGTELLRSAPLRLFNRHSAVRTKACRHSIEVFLRCCRVQRLYLLPLFIHSSWEHSTFHFLSEKSPREASLAL